MIEKDKANNTGKEGKAENTEPSLKKSSQLWQGQKSIGFYYNWDFREFGGVEHAEIT